MAGKVFEVGFDDGRSLLRDIFHHGLLVIRYGLALDNRDRSFGTGTDAGAEAVAKEVADKACLPVNHLERPFRAVWYALPAARAFFFINADDLPFHGRALPWILSDHGIKLVHENISKNRTTVVTRMAGRSRIRHCSTG